MPGPHWECWISWYLVPGLLVQVNAAVQRNPLYQLHCQHSGAGELVDHLWNLEEVITFQQASEGKWRWVLERRRYPGRGILPHT